METPPKQKSFSVPSFATHATRGIIRDQSSRRKMMSGTLIAAALMVICGVTVLQEVLSPREHALRFIAYWLTCAWFTLATLLLALFDALMVRAEARARRRALSNEIARARSGTPEKHGGK
jgi:hypothetical protein